MKTLLLAPAMFGSDGGIERMMRHYLRALLELGAAGDRVDAVVLNDGPGAAAVSDLARRAGTFAGCGRSKGRFLAAGLRLGWSADRIVCGHVHLLPVAWLLSLLRPRLRYFLVAHGIEVWRRLSWSELRAANASRRVLCVSDYTRREMRRHNPGLGAQRLVVVPNCLDPDLTEATGAVAAARRRGSPQILTVSRLTSADREKGVQTMIEAMPLILKERPRAHLRIVGGGNDLEHLARLARSLGLEVELPMTASGAGSASGVGMIESADDEAAEQGGESPAKASPRAVVSFAGRIDDDRLRAEYAACDLFALPSSKEGFGLVYLEAMAFGKPCLAANAGGAPEVVSAEAGVLVRAGNVDDVRDAVCGVALGSLAPDAIAHRAGEFTLSRLRERLRGLLAA